MSDSEVRYKRNILFWVFPLFIIALAITVYIVTRPVEETGGGGGGDVPIVDNGDSVNTLPIVLGALLALFVVLFFVFLLFRRNRETNTEKNSKKEKSKEAETTKPKPKNPKPKEKRKSSGRTWISRLSKTFSTALGSTNLVAIEEQATTPKKRYALAEHILKSNSNFAWGNEYTLMVAADAFKRPIRVMNTETQNEVVYGGKQTGEPIYLSFHWEVDNEGKHVTGGEHYSVRIPQQDIIGDGFCQFRSLAYVLYGDQNQYDKVKEEMLSHMKNNKEEMITKVLNPGKDVHNEVPRSLMLKTMTIPALEARIEELKNEIENMVKKEGEKVKENIEYIKKEGLIIKKETELEEQRTELREIQKR